MSRHEPNVVNTAQQFNKIVGEMEELIHKHQAPHHAVAPKRIECDLLFSLDIDDPIWNDRGLGDEESEPP